MSHRTVDVNSFEFVVVAALRAKQLIAGCVPRVLPGRKVTSTARLEVLAGKVARLPDEGTLAGAGSNAGK